MARRGRSGAQGGKQQRRISGEICTGGINHQPKSLGKLTYLCWKNLISETKESSPVLRERGMSSELERPLNKQLQPTALRAQIGGSIGIWMAGRVCQCVLPSFFFFRE